ncbi:hypothetical protein D3C86_1574030 [compost metagenome]
MADDGGLVQALFADVAGDLLGHRGGDGAGRIALGGRAGEALNMDAMDTVAARQMIDRALPDLGRGRQAGDQDQVGRAFGAVDAHMQAVRGEGGVGVAVSGVALGAVHVAVLGQGGLGGGQQQGGCPGSKNGSGADHGVSPRRF